VTAIVITRIWRPDLVGQSAIYICITKSAFIRRDENKKKYAVGFFVVNNRERIDRVKLLRYTPTTTNKRFRIIVPKWSRFLFGKRDRTIREFYVAGLHANVYESRSSRRRRRPLIELISRRI